MGESLLTATKDRLLGQVPAFKRVSGAAEISVALERGQFTADAYVVPLDFPAGANQILNGVSQTVQARIAVIFVVRHAGDATGDKALDQVDVRRDEVIAAVLGWAPTGAHKPFEYGGGKLLQFLPSAVIWTEEFVTSYLLRKVS